MNAFHLVLLGIIIKSMTISLSEERETCTHVRVLPDTGSGEISDWCEYNF